MFRDRDEAGALLAQKLTAHGARSVDRDVDAGPNAARRVPKAIVLGIPRGGVVVAARVARELGLPLDVVVATKVGAPGYSEFAIGAVSADGEVLVNPAAAIPAEEVRRLSGPAHSKATREVALFRAGMAPLDLENRTAIVVDDGLATGLTALAAVSYLRRMGATHVVLAVPVTPRDTALTLADNVDELVVLETPADFSAVGQFYRRFGQTDDAEVLALLAEARGRTIS